MVQYAVNAKERTAANDLCGCCADGSRWLLANTHCATRDPREMDSCISGTMAKRTKKKVRSSATTALRFTTYHQLSRASCVYSEMILSWHFPLYDYFVNAWADGSTNPRTRCSFLGPELRGGTIIVYENSMRCRQKQHHFKRTKDNSGTNPACKGD